MPHALVLQFPSAEALPSALLSRLPEPDYADEKRMRFIVEEGFSLSGADAALLDSRQIDHAVLPDRAFGELGLIVSDMDSTLITIECVDEIAAGVGLKDRVAEITERSMRGELDFEQSLRSRVALLAGLDEQVLAEVYENVLQLSPGAEFLLDECKAHGVKFMLVSGGFIARIPRPPRIAAASGFGDGRRCERYSDAQRSGRRRGLPRQTESAGSRRCLHQFRRAGARQGLV